MDKHRKYTHAYVKNDLYWGIGIENELYLEFDQPKEISKQFFLKNHKRERYSVNYFENYQENHKNESFEYVAKDSNTFKLPLLMNAHSFVYTDSKNNPKRKYTKACEPNEAFVGNTLAEDLLTVPFFRQTLNNNWLFDGDTIEFTTCNFYKTSLKQVVNELDNFKTLFISNLQKFFHSKNIFPQYGKITLMSKNHPFAIHLTNLHNVGIFNNGTLHYNITLPTKLNKYRKIANKKKFIIEHQRAIKIIQWFEPILISIYNTPDYFSTLEEYKQKDLYSKCSQRCAVSRYIGIGSYDSDLMITGKALNIPRCGFLDSWWYNQYHESSGYEKLNNVGLDINFNKYINHGIELRFFDFISDSTLITESFTFIIYLMDFILDNKKFIENPIHNSIWNNLVCQIMKHGSSYKLSTEELNTYEQIFGVSFQSDNVKEFYYQVYEYLQNKYKTNGPFSKLVLQEARESWWQKIYNLFF